MDAQPADAPTAGPPPDDAQPADAAPDDAPAAGAPPAAGSAPATALTFSDAAAEDQPGPAQSGSSG
jgi:hypothetical protein